MAGPTGGPATWTLSSMANELQPGTTDASNSWRGARLLPGLEDHHLPMEVLTPSMEGPMMPREGWALVSSRPDPQAVPLLGYPKVDLNPGIGKVKHSWV